MNKRIKKKKFKQMVTRCREGLKREIGQFMYSMIMGRGRPKKRWQGSEKQLQVIPKDNGINPTGICIDDCHIIFKDEL